MTEVKRGEIYWVDLDTTIGSEIRKTRPCVVVSNDIANHFSSLITVIPITSQNLDRIYPHEVCLKGVFKLKNSKAKVNQIRSIDKGRVGKKIAALPNSVMEKIDWALANHLSLVD